MYLPTALSIKPSNPKPTCTSLPRLQYAPPSRQPCFIHPNRVKVKQSPFRPIQVQSVPVG